MGLFGTYLKHYRTQQDLSLRRMADMLQVNPSILSRLERGEIATPSDDVLANLPEALERPKTEVYLAAHRVTPELAERLERGFPHLLEQLANMLHDAECHLEGLTQLPSLPLEEMLSPSDAATMQQIMESANDVAAIQEALLTGSISQEQFEQIAQLIHHIRLLVLPDKPQKETP